MAKISRQEFETHEWYYQKYVVECLTTREIAALLPGRGQGYVLNRLSEFNIPVKANKSSKNYPLLNDKEARGVYLKAKQEV